MLQVLNLVLILMIVATAVSVVLIRDLLVAAVILSAHGLLMAILWTRLSAPDLALVYVALFVCITTIMFVVVASRTTRKEER